MDFDTETFCVTVTLLLTTPRSTFDYSMTLQGKNVDESSRTVIGDFDPANYETERVMGHCR